MRKPSKLFIPIAIACVSVVLAFAFAALCLFGQGGVRSHPGSGAVLQRAVETGDVSPARAAAVEAGELTQTQAEALTTLDERAGCFAEQSVVLQGVSQERAEKLASDLGASLRITEDGSYARLTLPEGSSISDVLSSSEA